MGEVNLQYSVQLKRDIPTVYPNSYFSTYTIVFMNKRRWF